MNWIRMDTQIPNKLGRRNRRTQCNEERDEKKSERSEEGVLKEKTP